jgi:ribonuclease III
MGPGPAHRMEPLESLIEYTFRNPQMLTEALTHASLAYETQRPHCDNQRLEFLGDSVLQLILSNELYLRMKSADEGLLTKARSQLVSTKALSRIARQQNLGAYLLMGRGEEINGGRNRESTLADVFEALTGAIFLDGGLVAAQNFVLRSFAGDLETLRTSPLELNPKGELQEIIQSIGNTPPSYAILSSDGPDHLKSFIALVSWLGAELGRGTGRSKKEAESEAARDALNQPDLHARLQSAKSRPKEGGYNV